MGWPEIPFMSSIMPKKVLKIDNVVKNDASSSKLRYLENLPKIHGKHY